MNSAKNITNKIPVPNKRFGISWADMYNTHLLHPHQALVAILQDTKNINNTMTEIIPNPHFPVNSLAENILNTFLNLNHEEDFKIAISNGLSQRLILEQSDKKIFDVAELDYQNRIRVFDSFCQFYWCLCYSSLIFYDKGIMEKIENKTFNNNIDLDTEELKEAYDVFLAGIGLLPNDKPLTERNEFFRLPNPHNNTENKYVGLANAVYCYGMTFILFHEYSHFTLKHVESTVKNEEDADSSAFWTMLLEIEKAEEKTAIIGILTALSALIFLDSSLSGEGTHPDGDNRIAEILKQIDDEYDNYWGVVCILIKMWAFEYNLDKNFPLDTDADSWKSYSEIIFAHLKTLKMDDKNSH